jgi:hypothetical protein
VTYYEDPRRFPSRVIGLSFQGPRGGLFLPSGSRYLVSLVFAVKDFLKNLFPATPESDSHLKTGAVLRRPGGPKREAVYAFHRPLRQVLLSVFQGGKVSQGFPGFPAREDSTFVQ